MSTHKEAQALFLERFPRFGLLVPSWDAKEPLSETINALTLTNVEILYCYGLGDGALYFQCKEWLRENPERQLLFLEDDSGKIAGFLDTPNAMALLSDPQVHVEYTARTSLEIENLAERFPKRRIEVVAIPSYTNHKFRRMKLLLLRKTALSYALYLDRLQGDYLFRNFVQNCRYLPKSFYANSLRNAFSNVPAIVCGAGPSLHHSLSALKNVEDKALIIAGGSTIAALSGNGIHPHFGMAVDPNPEEYTRLKNVQEPHMPLLYSTRVCPSVLEMHQGPLGYMRTGIGGILELWLEEELGLTDTLIGEHLSAESISVTTICIAWAEFLGCNPILLNGVDLAYTDNRHYTAGVIAEGPLQYDTIDNEKSAADRILKRKGKSAKSVHTATRWIMEAASISYFAKKHPELTFINTTHGGLDIKGIPNQSLVSATEHFVARNVRREVQEKIQSSLMPPITAKTIRQKLQELESSLERCIAHLQVLTGEKKGSTVLAEMELKEEIAYIYLFYDAPILFKKQSMGTACENYREIPNRRSLLRKVRTLIPNTAAVLVRFL